MKKTLLIILLVVLVLLLLFIGLRRRGKRLERWQRLRQKTPVTQLTPTVKPLASPTPSAKTSVEEDLKEIDEMMGTLDPTKDFSDIPDKDLGL